ncbi:MAG: type II secretion system F family protein [Deltaproteobacteria bacterium]|nr:type II secretion system F family protein [Deltaproteobacteria bacterium]
MKPHQKIGIEFSLWLELLALCLEAGLDFTSSLSELTKSAPNSLVSQRFKKLLSHVQLGKTKQEALQEFQKEWQHPTIDTFCQTILYGWQHGISMSALLKEEASHIRMEALFQMEKEIHKKQLKLLLPLFLLILPAVMMVMLTPLLLQLLTSSFQ